jgi:hypothetical protein
MTWWVSFAAVKALTLSCSRVQARRAKRHKRGTAHLPTFLIYPSHFYQWWIRCRFPFLFTFAGMYTKQEASRLRQEFWTAFGQYMVLSLSTGGERVNWLNYKTGVRYLNFKMEAARDGASIAIVLSHPDRGQQQLYYTQLLQSKKILETFTGEGWQWDINGTVSSRLEGVNVFNREDWSAIISFLKPRLLALDAWWQEAKWGFE